MRISVATLVRRKRFVAKQPLSENSMSTVSVVEDLLSWMRTLGLPPAGPQLQVEAATAAERFVSNHPAFPPHDVLASLALCWVERVCGEETAAELPGELSSDILLSLATSAWKKTPPSDRQRVQEEVWEVAGQNLAAKARLRASLARTPPTAERHSPAPQPAAQPGTVIAANGAGSPAPNAAPQQGRPRWDRLAGAGWEDEAVILNPALWHIRLAGPGATAQEWELFLAIERRYLTSRGESNPSGIPPQTCGRQFTLLRPARMGRPKFGRTRDEFVHRGGGGPNGDRRIQAEAFGRGPPIQIQDRLEDQNGKGRKRKDTPTATRAARQGQGQEEGQGRKEELRIMLFPRPSVSSVLSSVLSPPLSSHFSHLSLTSACPRGAFTNTKARSATRRPIDTHPRQTRERTVDMHEFSRKVGLPTDTGATKDATTDAAADEYHHLGPSSLQAPVLLSGPGRVCTFHAGNGPPRLGCISDNAIRTPTGNHDCNSPSSGCKVVASPLQYAKTIHTFTCEDLPSRNSGLQRFSARSNSLLLDPCGGPPWSERNSSTSTTLDTNRFSNPTVQQQTFGHRKRSDPNTSPLALPIWRPPTFSFSSSESDPEDPSVCGQRKPDGQSSLEIHFNQRNSSTALTVSTTCAEECEISHTPKEGKIDTETKADYPPQLSTNRHYGTSRKVDLRPDCTSLRAHGSNSLHRNQTICGSLSQIERVPKADCHVEVPHPEIPVTKFPTVGLDMLFPVKHDHIGYDWYAPLNFTTFTQYNAPFIILPPTAPSPLASNTLRQRTPFSTIQQLELKRTPTRRINVDLAVQSPYFASFVPAYFEMLDPAGFQRSILNHHAFSTAPVYSRHLLRHLPTMLADDIAEETQIADLMDISGWFGVASTVRKRCFGINAKLTT